MPLKNTQSTDQQNSSQTSTQRSTNCGFTLIELLTVIAIIGILAAILIPALSGIRLSAYKTETVSDLRQIFVAVTLATNENNGFLPGPTHTGVSAGFQDSTSYSLSKNLSPYLTTTPSTNSGWYTVEELLPETFEELSGNYDENGKGPTYNINQDVYTEESFSVPFGYKATEAKPEGTTPRKLNTVPDPAVCVMLYGVDALSLDGNPSWKANIAQGALFGDDRPFLYWDGHVEVSTRLRPGEPLDY